MSNPSRQFIALGAGIAMLSVIAGAFGAHALKHALDAEMMAVYRTAVEYQTYHALGLILCGLLLQTNPSAQLRFAAILMLAGIIIFSGSLYALSLSGVRWLGAITPIGGLSFIIAWSLIMVEYLRKGR